MPAYSFKEQFCGPVERGDKTHTIRAKRTARPKAGQRFVGYYGMRTKKCRKLLDSIITRVQDVFMFVNSEGRAQIDIDGVRLAEDEREALAIRDGFKSWREMADFWNGRYPFEGDLIHWKYPSEAFNEPGKA